MSSIFINFIILQGTTDSKISALTAVGVKVTPSPVKVTPSPAQLGSLVEVMHEKGLTGLRYVVGQEQQIG